MTNRSRQYRWFGGLAVVGLVIAAIPVRLGRHESGNDTGAIAGLKQISAAEIAYAASCGNGGFAASFNTLTTQADSNHQPFLEAGPVPGTASWSTSHVFTLGPGLGAAEGPKDCAGRPTRTAYYAAAVPRDFERTGSRSFALNTEGVIWQVNAPTAPVEPFAAPATPIR